MVQILYFGRLSDVTGTSGEAITLPPDVRDTLALRHWLDETKATNGALLEQTVRLALNNEIVEGPQPVSDGDEVAFMPPVGGG